uniref:Ferredoxin--NADP reductase, leaf isozyme n=1 Tax=Arundo donax TaxID=35708 RepID=A0A0A9B6F0_ARUDO
MQPLPGAPARGRAQCPGAEAAGFHHRDGSGGTGAGEEDLQEAGRRGGDQHVQAQGAVRWLVPDEHQDHRRRRARGDVAHGLQHRGQGRLQRRAVRWRDR